MIKHANKISVMPKSTNKKGIYLPAKFHYISSAGC